LDAVSLQPLTESHVDYLDDNINPFLEADTAAPLQVDASAPTPTLTTTSRTITPTPQLLAIQRKRRRGREDEGTQSRRVRLEETNGSETAEAIKALAKAKIEAAQIATTAVVKNDVPEAIVMLSKEFTKAPRKLNADNMQIAIDFLSNPDMATLFLTLSKQPEMEAHRDRWLERQTGIDISL
jgi:hypothetical protein